MRLLLRELQLGTLLLEIDHAHPVALRLERVAHLLDKVLHGALAIKLGHVALALLLKLEALLQNLLRFGVRNVNHLAAHVAPDVLEVVLEELCLRLLVLPTHWLALDAHRLHHLLLLRTHAHLSVRNGDERHRDGDCEIRAAHWCSQLATRGKESKKTCTMDAKGGVCFFCFSCFCERKTFASGFRGSEKKESS